MTQTALSETFVPLSHALRLGQWDKNRFAGTIGGTAAGQVSLKALAINVLQRDNVRDNGGTSERKLVGQEEVKKTVLSHPLSHPETGLVPPPKADAAPDSPLVLLATMDTNIAALVGWGLTPHLEAGELVLDGMDTLDVENRAGLERWFAHKGLKGEPRRMRVIRALQTGRRATC